MASETASEKSTAGEAALVWCAAAAALLIWGATPMITRLAVLEIEPSAVGILRTVLAPVLAVAPLFTGLFAAAVERRAPKRDWWLGAALAFAGEVALVSFRGDLSASEASLGGDLLVLTACLSAAAGYVAGARLATGITPWATTFWGIGLGGVILLPLAVVRLGPQAWGGAGPVGWSAVVYLALGATIAGYICWYWALQRGGIARIGATQFAQPVIALGFAVTILREPLTAPLVIAALLIIAGVALAQRRGWSFACPLSRRRR